MSSTSSVSFSLAGAFRGLSVSPTSSTSYLRGDFGSSTLNNKCSVSFPWRSPLSIEAAHKKGAGSTKNGRDSRGQRLGVKIYGDQVSKPGAIIIRQRETKVHQFDLKWWLSCLLSIVVVLMFQQHHHHHQ